MKRKSIINKSFIVHALSLIFLFLIPYTSSFAQTNLIWTYYNSANQIVTSETDIATRAVMRTSPGVTDEYILNIDHDFSGTLGTGYLENIGNPLPAKGRHWIAKDQRISPQVDGIVPDVYNVNNRYIAASYKATGSPNTGQNAHAIQFDGVNDYVSVDSINLDNASSFTIEFWAKRDQLGRNECLFGQGTTSEPGKGIEFGYWQSQDMAKVHIPGWDNTQIWASANSATDTGWHQWKIEYIKDTKSYNTTSGDGFHINIYRDGQTVRSGASCEVAPSCTTQILTRDESYTETVCDGWNIFGWCVWGSRDVERTRTTEYNEYQCVHRTYTGTGLFYIGRGTDAVGSYFKGQMKDIAVTVNGQSVGEWEFNDGNPSLTAADNSGNNRTATLKNFNVASCWVADPNIEKNYTFNPIQSKQVIPPFSMTGPSSITYKWEKQFAVNVSTIPDTLSHKSSVQILDPSGQNDQIGSGQFWYKFGTELKLSSQPDDCMQLIGYRDNRAIDPNKEIPSNERIINSLESWEGVTWVYSQFIYEETVTIGNPVSFSSVPLAIQQKTAIQKKPLYKTDPTHQTPEDQMIYWSPSENKLYPVMPDQTFSVEWEMIGECPGTRLITQITTRMPNLPHYIHVAGTPPVNLDLSSDDLMAFKAIKYTSGDATVSGKDFSASKVGESVLVFTRGDTISNTEPKEISLKFKGDYGYADAGNISLNRGAFTIEFWAKRSAVGMLQAAVGQGIKEADKGLLIGFKPDNKFMFSFFGNDLLTGDAYSDTDWHHWACVYEAVTDEEEGECFQCINDPSRSECRWNETTCYTRNFTGKSVYENGNWQWNPYYYANRCMKSSNVQYHRVIYRDGVQVAEDTTPYPYKGKGSLRIGSTGEGWNPSSGFNGNIDEMRIWEIARTPQMIRQDRDSRLSGAEEGLIGYWRFDNIGGTFENDSRILADSSAISSDEVNALEQPVMSRICLDFNGTNQYVLMDNPFSDGANFSIEMWVNPELIDGASHALAGWQDSTGKRSPSLIIGPYGALQWDSYHPDGTRFEGTIENFFSANRWVHVAWVKNGTSYRFYKNGTHVKTADAPVTVSLFSRYEIGKTAGYYFKGQLDDIRIWNIARTEEHIKTNLNAKLTGNEAGLAAYYPIDALFTTDRSIVTDLTAGKKDGVMTNMISSSAIVHSPVPGSVVIGNALNFDGANDYVRTGIYDLSGTELTIEYGFKGFYMQSAVRQQSGSSYIVSGWNRKHILSNDGGTGGGVSTGPVDDGMWHHVAMTWKMNTTGGFSSYLDGVLIEKRDSGNTPIQLDAEVLIGSYGGTSEFLNGSIDELRIWNIARTQESIRSTMNTTLTGNEPGLKVYYDFNQTSGTLLPDKTAASLNGTLVNFNSNPTPWVSGITTLMPTPMLSGAIQFDGVDDYIKVPEGVWFNGNFTVEGWVYVRNYNDWSRLIDFGNGSEADNLIVGISERNRGKLFCESLGFQMIAPYPIPKNQWTHVAVTLQGTTCRMYMNGIEVASGTMAIPRDVTRTRNYIGKSNRQDPYTNAIFDEIRIWSIARSQADILNSMSTSLAGNETGLILYYNFDNKPFEDMSASKTDLLNFGAGAVFFSKSVYPFTDRTFMAMGSGTSYMEIPDSTSLNLTSGLTVEAWIHPDSITNAKIVGKADSPASKKGYVLGVSGEGELYPEIWDTNGGNYSFSAGKIEAGQWTHIAMTWKTGGNLTGYINGFKVGEVTAGTNNIAVTANPLRIGAAPWDINLFKLLGKIDEVRIWNIERSHAEIRTGLMMRLSGREPGLVAYYNFDDVQDNRLADRSSFNNKGIIYGATFIQEGLSDNVVHHPLKLVNMEPSGAWVVNTSKLYEGSPDTVADSGIACVRVVETIDAEGDKMRTGTASVGTELTSIYHGSDVPHNGYVYREIGPYNPNIYDRASKIGAIYPVNKSHPSLNPKEDKILVVWYRMQDNIAWSYQPVEYSVVLPGDSKRVVIASRIGSEGKDNNGSDQTYPDVNGNPQNYLDPARYTDVKIYNQPDMTQAGYNPNEEHALAAPSFRHSQMSPQPVAAFALRNDLNIITNTTDYTSDPYVLVQYFDKVLGRHGMTAFKVETDDPQCGYTFLYDMKAGEPIVAPYPLNTVIAATPPPEIFGKNGGAAAQKCYWEDHKGQPWTISGAGKTMNVSEVAEIRPTEYQVTTTSETFKLDDYYLIKVTDHTGPVGSFKFKVGQDAESRSNEPVHVNGYFPAGGSMVTVTLYPGITGLGTANFQLYHYTSDSHVLSYFWYPLDPTFWCNGSDRCNKSFALGDGAGDVGKPVPLLTLDPIVNVTQTNIDNGSFPSNLKDKPLAKEIRYDVTWPDNTAILKAGETLTFSGGEYRSDHSESPALPGVLGWAAGQVVFDELNPTTDSAKLFTHYLVRLTQVLEERSVDLKIDNFPEDFKPAAKRVDVVMNRYYFKDLHAGLRKRICYDPITEKLIMRGFINDRTMGDRDLTAAPPAVYVTQPNIMTATESLTINDLEGVNNDFIGVVNKLYDLTRNPKSFLGTDKTYSVGIDGVNRFLSGLNSTEVAEQMKQFFATWLGVTFTTDTPERYFPEISLGPGLALMPNDALLNPNEFLDAAETIRNPYYGVNEGYVTLAENNHPELGALPVVLHIIKVKNDKYRGAIKTVFSDNVFDEKITLRHTADFGGKANELVFQWWYREEDGTNQNIPNLAPDPWRAFPDFSGNNGLGMPEIILAGAGSALLSDNLFFVRYRHYLSPENVSASWSDWAGAANSRPPKPDEDPMDTYQAQLCEGWIKRVLNGVNPFEARIKDFSNSDSPATYASMIQQAGPRYEGPVAFNPQKDVIENVGLIELYQTVLERGKSLSINLTQPVCTSGVTAALMLAASRISGFYTLLGNEAYTDALDPTIGYGTSSVEYGSLAPTIFAFTNQVPSLLDEELGLLRGRSESGARPVYNRLMWNFTKDRGEAAYAMSYNINDVNKDGLINDADGQKLYHQGHGDAWGHYLSAVKSYYDLLRHPVFKWESRSEKFQIQGVVMDVDYLDERNFAEAAAAKAKVGREITDLTYRSKYVDDPDGQWQGYKDTDMDRAWGVSEWSRRAGLSAYFDWAMVNAILPPSGAFRLNRSDLDRLKAELPLDMYNELNTHFENQGYATQDEFIAALTTAGIDPTPYPNILKYAEKTGLKKIDRTTVQEILEITSQGRQIQKQADDVNTGLNPLGLASNTVPFDIDPVRMLPTALNPATHFDQVYERAISALENARIIFDYANDLKNRIRQAAISTQEFTEQVYEQDRDYRNRLIEIFGTPYEGTIGTGKVYPSGYQGPDYFLYNYIDVNEVSDESVPPPKDEFTAYFSPMNTEFKLEDNTTTGSISTLYSHFLLTDRTQDYYSGVDSSSILAIEFPQSAGKYSFQAPAEWGMRKSPGEIQQALIELVKSEADLQLALAGYVGLLLDIEGTVKLLKARSDLRAEEVKIGQDWISSVHLLNRVIIGFKTTAAIADSTREYVNNIVTASTEALPKVVGMASDISFAGRGILLQIASIHQGSLRVISGIANFSAAVTESSKEIQALEKEMKIQTANYKYDIQQQLKALEDKLINEGSTRLAVFKARENMRQVSEKYQAVLGKGLRLLEERKAFNAKVSAKTQGSRYMDMNFRLSLNDALSKYRSMFDVAARFAFLAAKAYDYETNLSDRDMASPKPLITDIMHQRTIGQYQNGRYIVGQGGLGDSLTRLKANFDVLKTQMGLNNPQSETSRMSLRYEKFRIKKDRSENGAWRAELLKAKQENLWTVPEFRKYCRPFAAESNGAQPGLVIPFESKIVSGKNFFGRKLGGGDHAYDPTNFATKVRSVGIWFEGYDNSLLAETPRVYLIPAGLDIMLVPNSTELDDRKWTIVDQKIPIPLPVGNSDLVNPNWFPSLDSLNGPMVQIRKYSSARAYHDSGYFDVNQMNYDSRLIGRSVWNTQWLLIIPGATFHYDADEGLESFINSVTDIKLFFQTYAISGN